jgi:hypothetical protein
VSLPLIELAVKAQMPPGVLVYNQGLESLWFTPLVGCGAGVFILLLGLLGAALLGTLASLRERRNLLPGAAQLAAYLSTSLLVGALIGWASGLFIAAEPLIMDRLGEGSLFSIIGEALRVHPEFAAFLFWLTVNLIWLVFWAWSLWRALMTVRFANR